MVAHLANVKSRKRCYATRAGVKFIEHCLYFFRCNTLLHARFCAEVCDAGSSMLDAVPSHVAKPRETCYAAIATATRLPTTESSQRAYKLIAMSDT